MRRGKSSDVPSVASPPSSDTRLSSHYLPTFNHVPRRDGRVGVSVGAKQSLLTHLSVKVIGR